MGQDSDELGSGQDKIERDTIVSVADAAVLLGISQDAVRKRIRRGQLVAQKVGAQWFVVLDALPVARQDRTEPDDGTRQDEPLSRPETGQDSETIQQVTVSDAARHQIDVLRDSLVAPLVALTERQQERIAELERDRGRLEAENVISQQRAKELEQERDELRRRVEDQIAAMDDDDEGPISIAEAESVRELERERDALQSRVRELEQRQVESPQPVQTTSQGRPQRTQKPRQRRWWLRLFGVDE